MKPITLLVAVAGVCTMAACQSTPQPAPTEPVSTAGAPTSASAEIWQADADGNLTHVQSGAVCTASVGDMVRVREMVFSADGMDVACHYEAVGGAILTRYFTYLPEMNAVDHANGAAQVAIQTKGLNLDEEDSQTCSLGMSITDAMSRLESQSVVYGDTPCRILTGGGLSSLVAVQVEDGWHDKLRITQLGDEKSDLDWLMETAVDAYHTDALDEAAG